MNLHKAIILTSPLVVAGACVNAANAAFVLHQNAYWSGETLIASQLDTTLPLDAAFADDFVVTGPHDIITEACWYGGYYNGAHVPGDWTVTLYDDIAGMPGNVLYIETFPYAGVNELAVGFDQYGDVNYSYHVVLSQPFQAAIGSTYWIAFQGNANYPPQSGVSGTSTITYNQGHFGSNYFGYGYWVPTSSAFGVAYDIPFCVMGVPAPSSVALLSAAGLLSRRRR